MGWKRQGFINILTEQVKTTKIYKHSRITGRKQPGFIKILAEWVENDKDL